MTRKSQDSETTDPRGEPRQAELWHEVRASLVDGLPEILLVLDREGTITFASGPVVSPVKISAADP